MHCEIVDCHFNIFFVEIKLKIEILKSVFWVPEFGCPNWYTSFLNGLNVSLQYNRTLFRTLSNSVSGAKIVNS